MNDTVTVEALTADDVHALRRADNLSFHVYEGKASIRAYLGTEDWKILTAREQRVFKRDGSPLPGERMREIACQWGAHGYPEGDGMGIAWRGEESPDLSAYASVVSGTYNALWPTTSSLIGAGDTLTLHWTADCNTGTIREAGLHVDTLTITATSASGKRERTFHVDTSITPDNSARMIRRFGR